MASPIALQRGWRHCQNSRLPWILPGCCGCCSGMFLGHRDAWHAAGALGCYWSTRLGCCWGTRMPRMLLEPWDVPGAPGCPGWEPWDVPAATGWDAAEEPGYTGRCWSPGMFLRHQAAQDAAGALGCSLLQHQAASRRVGASVGGASQAPETLARAVCENSQSSFNSFQCHPWNP